MVILLAAGGLVYGSARLGLQLIFDPNAVIWVNRFLPDWTRIPTANQQLVQTLGDVQATIRQSGFIPGEMIPLRLDSSKASEPADLLLPVMAKASGCANSKNCHKIVELRVYQPVDASGKRLDNTSKQKRPQFFWLASQIEVAGPDENIVASPLSDSQVSGSDGSRSLPLTAVEIFQDQAPKNGIWLNLNGQYTHNNQLLFYGQVLHYNPETTYLGSMLSWSGTPSVPVWQAFTGGGAPELVVNHTVGLEPQFRVYRIKPRKFLLDPIHLEPISLREPAIPTRPYQSILSLARSGLWTPAGQWLESVKQQVPAKQWTPDAQAQLDYIQLHANVTKAQAQQQWGSASQQIFVYLIDGQWARAIATMQANLRDRDDILTMLKTDSGRLWNRVIAALKVNPARADAQFWGALILMAQQGKPKAMKWMLKQPGSDADYVKAIRLMNQLDPPKPPEKPKASSTQPSATPSPGSSAAASPNSTQLAPPPPSTHPSRIIGTAVSIGGIDTSRWSVPTGLDKPRLETGQGWYEVTVNRFHDGRTWRRSPFYELPARVDLLWNLMALDREPYLTFTVWTAHGEQQTVNATIKALQVHGNELRLLAAGDATAISQSNLPASLALSNQAIVMLQPSTTTLAALSQQNPLPASKLLQHLWQDLQQAGLLIPSATPTLQEVLSRTDLGSWQIQLLDLTGNNMAEIILKLDGEAVARVNAKERSQAASFSGSRTLIFADNGTLLYSELTTDAGQMMMAIGDLGDSRPPAIVVYGSGSYSIQRWSSTSKRFE